MSSASRKNLWHWCDLENDVIDYPVCTCESFRLRKERPCRHLIEVVNWIVEGLQAPVAAHAVLRGALMRYIAPGVFNILPKAEDILLDEPNRCVIDTPQPRKYRLHKAA